MAIDFRSRWETFSPNTKRAIMLASAFGVILFVSFLTTLLEKDEPKLDRLDTAVDVEMMLPERRDATLDELNASQIAAARRITRMEQNLKSSQKAMQDALRELQAQLAQEREPKALGQMQTQLDYLTKQMRRVETTAMRADRKAGDLGEIVQTDPLSPDVIGPQGGPYAQGERVRPMPSVVGAAPGGEGGGDQPPEIPDLPGIPQLPGDGTAQDTPQAPELPAMPQLPGLPGIQVPEVGGGVAAAAPRPRPTLRMVSVDGQSLAGGGPPTSSTDAPTDADPSSERRIPTTARARSPEKGADETVALSDPPSSGGGGRTQRERRDREEEQRKTNNVSVYMPAGAMFSGVLLNGVDAMTSNAASSSPAPVLIRVKREAIVPNYFTVDVRECFVIAAGFGRMSTERMEARTERLSCVRSDGGVIDTKLEGYIIGEDGKVGMRGRLVSRYGAMLSRAGIAGLLSGFSEAMKPEFVNQLQIDPTGQQLSTQPKASDVVQGGLYGGVSSTSKEISQFFLDMARETMPTLEVDAGRNATIVVLRGTSLELE
ncbi:MAG: hypothetical protein EOM91_10190 [Sphingobacteriia bacterium]|jgi:uncharacterized coiled-coil protein SlyX|nr:hypothetical protein [Sphingobacteriia bacterium]